MELVARGTNGMLVCQWDPKSANWVTLSIGSPTKPTIFSDMVGWADPQYYTTIQLADLDGDGRAELVGRGQGGLYAYLWDAPTANWIGRLVPSCIMADKDGWAAPEYYATILLADIDGDGKAELVARSAAGLVAFRFHWQSESWDSMGSADGVMADIDGWAAPQSYLTIQAADVDRSGRMSIIGCAPDGIQTWRWAQGAGGSQSQPTVGFRGAATNGFYQPVAPGFPDYSGHPSQLLAYQLISVYALDSHSSWPPPLDQSNTLFQDVRTQYSNTNLSNWIDRSTRVSQLTVPAGFGGSAADFTIVKQQLQTELDYVDRVNTWFQHTSELLAKLFPEQNITLDIVDSALMLPPDDYSSIRFQIQSLVALMVSGMAAAVGGTISSAVTGLVSTALAAAVTGSGSGADIQTQVLNLRQQLVDTGNRATLANDTVHQAFLEHWGLLQPLGQSVADLVLQWAPTTTDVLVAAVQRNYEKELWRILTPAAWDVTQVKIGYVNGGRGNPGVLLQPPAGLPARYVYSWQSSSGSKFAAWPHVQGH